MDEWDLLNSYEFLEELTKKIPPDDGYKHFIEIYSENQLMIYVRYNNDWYYDIIDHFKFKNGIYRKVINDFVNHITKYVGEICYG